MDTFWLGLFADIGLMAILLAAWSHLGDRLEGQRASARVPVFGLLMAFGACCLMSFPIRADDGIYIDLRSVPLAIAAFWGGPVAGAIAGGAALVYRVHLGGVGMPAGLLSITLVSLAATAVWWKVRLRGPRLPDILLVSLTVAVVPLASFPLLPSDVWRGLLVGLGLPSSMLICLSMLVFSLALDQDRRRREAHRDADVFRSIIEAMPDCINAKDLQGRFVAANPATAKLMKAASPRVLIGRTDFDFYPADLAEAFRADEERTLSIGAPLTMEQRYLRPDGSEGWLITLKAPMRDAAGDLAGLITHNRDITEWKALHAELAESRARLSDALAHMADALVMFDRDGRIVFSNDRYRDLFPKTGDFRIPGTSLRQILAAAVARGEEEVASGNVEAWIAGTIASLAVEGKRTVRLGDGRWLEARTRPLSDGGALVVFSDVTAAKSAEEALLSLNHHLEALARTDGLTGLLNRRAFDLTLDKELARAQRNGSDATLLLIDIDRFKAFNDRYGHPAGDRCLRAVSQCLQGTLYRPGDIAARYGGEELAAILPDTDAEGGAHIAEAFRQSVRALDVEHLGSEHGRVTVSIGVATIRRVAGSTSGDLVAAADTALYAAKASGRDRFVLHGRDLVPPARRAS
ncbi:diguanylate cyclase [Methylobrevis pamukkalensis]|uniref:Phytochrome-like protein cph2 n=1 Tax=Methylobrevis pamukkalensis TaxID=1439726 RepID=A0A1E3H1L7_9HYPH|nr:diguanylate cyclase [Methylobrevis pamukkalensis]ODN70228.1 Phytochrome-like protein cph2 [Methylobrevis pamukkalensis]